jgi:two-component system sensor histidine kinase GlrK
MISPFLEIYHQSILRDFATARVTHDIRRDLKEIDETTRLVLDEDKRMSDHHKRQLENIINKIPSISHLSTRLDFTRIEKVSYKFRLTLLEGEIIARLKNLHKAESEYKKLNIHFDGFQAIPAIYVDPPRFETAIDNLLMNAIKYADKVTRIEILAERTPTGFLIHITDIGIPIEKDELEAIFLPYYRGKNVIKGGYSIGEGLGLCIAKEIIEAHDSYLKVKSEGKKVIFTIDLPKYLEKEEPKQ